MKKSLEGSRHRGRNLLLAALPVVLVLAAAWFADRSIWQGTVDRIAQSCRQALEQESFIISARLRSRVNDALLLKAMAEETRAESPQTFGASPSFAILAETLMRVRPVYDQVRLLNLAGFEVFRLNLDQKAVPPVVVEVPAAQLQDKSGRPYFREVLNAPGNVVLFSALDLNIERNQVEIPFKAVVRVTTQIQGADGQKAGLLVLNYLGDNLLRELRSDQSASSRVLLLDGSGYWIVGPTPEDEWGFMFPDRQNRRLDATHPELWGQIQKTVQGTYQEKGSYYFYTSIDPLSRPTDYPPLTVPVMGQDDLHLKLLIKVPTKDIATETLAARLAVWLLGLVASMILGPAVWFGLEAIDRRAAALRQARAAEQAKAEFLAMMSHEIRTPLNGVLGFADLLADAKLQAEQHEHVSTIRGTGESLLRIIDDILDFSRLEAGKLPIEHRPFVLSKVAEEVVALLRPKLNQKGVEVRAEIDPEIPAQLMGDGGRLRQVLTNLAGNAAKFTMDGCVLLAARKVAHAAPDHEFLVEFRVTDTGVGIPEGQLDKIFHPFVQADDGVARRYGGSGLGLAISRLLVELMGGEITVKSKIGEGTAFSFTLPFSKAEEDAKEAEHVELSKDFAREHPLRLLLADDNLVNLKLVSVIAQRLGYEPLTATSGKESVRIYEQEKPDCILLDVQMPDISGNEAATQIREIEKQSGSPGACYIVALSASVVPAERELCLRSGMNEYLTKPIRRQALMDAFAEASRRRRGAA